MNIAIMNIAIILLSIFGIIMFIDGILLKIRANKQLTITSLEKEQLYTFKEQAIKNLKNSIKYLVIAFCFLFVSLALMTLKFIF